jgi:hypothetical protein
MQLERVITQYQTHSALEAAACHGRRQGYHKAGQKSPAPTRVPTLLFIALVPNFFRHLAQPIICHQTSEKVNT